ncbi:alpha/beta fold hydrolase [Nocardiopsis composta]|uniref:Pimeloyl-ACP methyl ester carboxylesterase n=1 Tax=Nocardiopsis composta TaxID=157465 RepID=A0A7W8QR47_9ACTN|nr:alpha/beta hydrolase [Nocardiopsis composta]MBB5435073.1 pimeloyl-ACP methyl ester carboxylesterase [Nocardiopsis composta]
MPFTELRHSTDPRNSAGPRHGALTDVRLFHTEHGPEDAAHALLLVHGWGSDSHEWVQHIPHLAERYRVIAADLRGHGSSGVPPSGNTPRAMAADLAALLDGLPGRAPVTAVGHSMGGQVVGLLAADRPDLVHALVTVDPGYGFPAAVAEAFPRMAEALRGPDAVRTAIAIDAWDYTPATPAWIRTWHDRRLEAAAPHVLAEAFAAMFTDPGAIGARPAAERHLAERTRPTLSFRFDPEHAEWERPLLRHPASEVVCWPGSGHRLHEERPAEFLLVLERWLERAVPEGGSGGPHPDERGTGRENRGAQ